MDSKDTAKANELKAEVFKSIETLLEPGLGKECVREACAGLDVVSFSDASEERALAKLCGYPLCSSQLQGKTWSKYVIKCKKVYDTTERRRFCSDECYERYLHIAKQLPEEPLWFRGEPSGQFQLSFLEDGSTEGSASASALSKRVLSHLLMTKTISLITMFRGGLPGQEVAFEGDLINSMSQLTVQGDSTTKPPSGSGAGHLLRDDTNRSDSCDVDDHSMQQARLQNNPENGGGKVDDDDNYTFFDHIDCESSSLGNWQPSRDRKGTARPTQKPRRPILIDPLPLLPAKKENTRHPTDTIR